MAEYDVLYRTAPAWLVGEDEINAVVRRRVFDATSSEGWYPDDYRGKIISVKRRGFFWRPGDLVDPARKLAQLNLSVAEVAALRSHNMKLDATERPAVVTFDDRHGATAADLRVSYPGLDVEDVEALSEDDEKRQQFDRLAMQYRRELPKVVVHSGAGFYEVGPTKTYSTVQSALDQLWTDQGSATFTEMQYIRIFADTYDESDITPNAGLDQDETNGYTLIIEGDPGDSRANIIIAPSSGTNVFYVNCDMTIIRHLTVDGGSVSDMSIKADSGCLQLKFSDAIITDSPASKYALYALYDLVVLDCEITTAGNGILAAYNSGTHILKRTKLVKSGAKGATAVLTYHTLQMEGCTVTNFTRAVYDQKGFYGKTSVKQCTFYNCTKAIEQSATAQSHVELFNNIFESVDYVLTLTCWPDEGTEGEHGSGLIMRNNIWRTNTAFAYDGSVTKSYAQVASMDMVDAAGDWNETDPKLTDAAGGDFSLAADSPCRHAGHGSGVVTDVEGNPFDAYHPNMGAHAIGAGPNVCHSG